MALVIVCSPFRTATPEEKDQLKRFLRYLILTEGEVPIAPHLHYPQVLDDKDPDERSSGLKCSQALVSMATKVYVLGERITPGMRKEIHAALRWMIRVVCVSEHDGYWVYTGKDPKELLPGR